MAKRLIQGELAFAPRSPQRHLRPKDGAFRILSLFSGCGGLDLGFVGGFEFLGVRYPKTGMSIAWAADFDKDAVSTYTANAALLGCHPVFADDIREFGSFSELPEFEVLTAGFPCQPFSNAGDREGFADSRGRGNLFQECERFIENARKKPLAYVFENVKGILSSKMPSGRSVPDEIACRMEKLGYAPTPPVLLRAQDYGVPQQRHRVFMIGVQKGLGPAFDPRTISEFVRSESLERLTVRDVLRGAARYSGGKEHWALSPQAMKLVPLIRRSWKDIPYSKLPPRFKRIRDQMEKYRAPNFYRRFALDEINGTITASAQPENCGILHPEENRRYTVREVARFQSFPDKFKFVATTVQGKYKVIGNAVPPVLAHAVGKALQRHLVMAIAGERRSDTRAAG